MFCVYVIDWLSDSLYSATTKKKIVEKELMDALKKDDNMFLLATSLFEFSDIQVGEQIKFMSLVRDVEGQYYRNAAGSRVGEAKLVYGRLSLDAFHKGLRSSPSDASLLSSFAQSVHSLIADAMPNDADLNFDRAYDTLCRYKQEFVIALEYIKSAIMTNPLNRKALSTLHVLSKRIGDWDRAEDSLLRLLVTSPSACQELSDYAHLLRTRRNLPSVAQSFSERYHKVAEAVHRVGFTLTLKNTSGGPWKVTVMLGTCR